MRECEWGRPQPGVTHNSAQHKRKEQATLVWEKSSLVLTTTFLKKRFVWFFADLCLYWRASSCCDSSCCSCASSIYGVQLWKRCDICHCMNSIWQLVTRDRDIKSTQQNGMVVFLWGTKKNTNRECNACFCGINNWSQSPSSSAFLVLFATCSFSSHISFLSLTSCVRAVAHRVCQFFQKFPLHSVFEFACLSLGMGLHDRKGEKEEKARGKRFLKKLYEQTNKAKNIDREKRKERKTQQQSRVRS